METVKKLLFNTKTNLELKLWWAEEHNKESEFIGEIPRLKLEIDEIDQALTKLFFSADDDSDEYKEKASVEEEYENFYCSEYEDGEWKCETQCLGCQGLQDRLKNYSNNKPSVIKNPNCDCDKSDDGYCTNLLCQNFYPQ